MKNLAEKALNYLLLNESVDGIRFGPIPQMLFTSCAPKEPRIAGQVYINLSSRWSVFSTRPQVFPQTEADLPEITQEQELRLICDLREAVVQSVELGPNAPHLILTMTDGRVVFINGSDDNYEPWETGVAFEPIGLTVIACPGGEVALFGAEFLMTTDER